MHSTTSIDELDAHSIQQWLGRALRGREALPRITPDEAPHLAILRLEKGLKPTTRDSIRDACLELLREFGIREEEDTAYVEELLSLVSAFANPAAVYLLVQQVHSSDRFEALAPDIRIAMLTALIDTPPPQPPEFWISLLSQNSEMYADMALSGVLAFDPEQAVAILPKMTNTTRAGQSAAAKLELAWDALPMIRRFHFVASIREILMNCGSSFAEPVREWTNSKESCGSATSPTLRSALSRMLGDEAHPKALTPKLCASEHRAA